MLYDVSNKVLLASFDKLVRGHEIAKKTLITLVNRAKLRHYQKWIQGVPEEDLLTPSKVMLIGGSGTGKTFLVESLQKLVNFPLIKLDATKLNPTGASGGITARDLEKMIKKNAEHVLQHDPYYYSLDGVIDQTVVFIDEMDKLASSFDSSGNWNKHTQSNFLTLFDNYEEFSGVSFIFAGAFTDCDFNNKTQTKQLGFTAKKDDAPIDGVDLEEAIIKAGLIPEIVGRINHIVRLDTFTESDYYAILEDIVLPRKNAELAMFRGESLDLSDEQKKSIVDKVIRSKQGVRFLKRELDKLSLELEFSYEDNPILIK